MGAETHMAKKCLDAADGDGGRGGILFPSLKVHLKWGGGEGSPRQPLSTLTTLGNS